jgi:D-3-phosphoglycerate dehydrogenase
MPSVTAEEAPRLRPYMNLAEQLGSFMGQIVEGNIACVEVEYQGGATELNTRPLNAIVLQSLLAPTLDLAVNMVNAPVIAKEKGIEVTEKKLNREADYHTLVRLSVNTQDNKTYTIAGTLFADRAPRIVDILGIDIDAQLGKHLLFVRNDDKPGFIGALGTILGNAGINIANFTLGRVGPGQGAIALVDVDQPIGDDLLKQICALPHMRQAKSLSF